METAELFIGTRDELWPKLKADGFRCEACGAFGDGPFIETCRTRIGGGKSVHTRVCVECLRLRSAKAWAWIDKGWRRAIADA